MKPNHRWIVIYDILDKKRLTKVAKLMESFGIRIQRSVFEMAGSGRLVELVTVRLESILEDVDSVIFIPLCVEDYGKTVRMGTAMRMPDTELTGENIFL